MKSLEGPAIKPGAGLGSARFGMTVRHVEAVLGRAGEASFDEDRIDRKLELHYPGVWLSFYQSNDFRLSAIDADEECACRLFGEPLFPRTRQGLLELLRRNLSEEEMDEIEQRTVEAWKEITVTLPSLRMTFYCHLNETLESVEWSEFVE